tara:strand:- start:6410 stop:6661 length:252 start_codon:yes stop_codon:yes gene_type:complete
MKKPSKKNKVTLVIWYDAVAENGWITKEDAKKNCKLDKCVSIGHLVDRNEERILLACTKSENEYNALINIPNTWIDTIKEYNL